MSTVLDFVLPFARLTGPGVAKFVLILVYVSLINCRFGFAYIEMISVFNIN